MDANAIWFLSLAVQISGGLRITARHLARRRGQQSNHTQPIAHIYEFLGNATRWSAIVIIAKRHTHRRRLKTEFLIGRSFTRAAAHERSLILKRLVPAL